MADIEGVGRPAVCHILLIGFMGAGKSTVGRIVASRLGRPFVDLDELIEVREGATVAEIFESAGEPAFRAAESAALAALADSAPSVVACGGGVVIDDGNRAALKRLGTVVYLQVGADEAMARIGSEASRRPLLAGGGAGLAASLLRSREALYEATGDAVVATTGLTPEQVAASVIASIEGGAS